VDRAWLGLANRRLKPLGHLSAARNLKGEGLCPSSFHLLLQFTRKPAARLAQISWQTPSFCFRRLKEQRFPPPPSRLPLPGCRGYAPDPAAAVKKGFAWDTLADLGT